MKIKGQSKAARELRLIFGRCPIHGLAMKPVKWVSGQERLIVECPRCGLRGDELDIRGPVVLFSDHMEILAEDTKKQTKNKR